MIDTLSIIYVYVVVFAMAIYFHELGHFTMFKVFGYKPKLNISLRESKIIVYIEAAGRLKIKEYLYILIIGVFAGLIFIIWSPLLTIIYLIGSCHDLSNIFSFVGLSNKEMTLYEFNRKECNKQMRELNEYNKINDK